ncbi:MAG: ABC transporter permease [Bacteroidota bacterium]|nr:ABC transporter permease [Bacteroidota bacterium]
MRKTQATYLVFSFLSGMVLLFLVGPLVSLFLSSTPNNIFETSGDAEVIRSIWLTLWTSMVGTLVFAIAAIPFAYLLARKNFPLKKLVNGVIDLPIVIPHTAAGIALLGSISRDTWVGKLANGLGIDFIGHPAGIAMAMAFVSLPFLINAARDGFAAVPEKLEKAAMNLGATRWRAFSSISVPLAWRNILSGLIMMFARGMSEFGAVVIIAYHPMIAPVMIYERFSSFGLDYARPVAILFIAVSLVFFLLLRLISKKEDHAED